MRQFFGFAAMVLALCNAFAFAGQSTYCNPLDINYQYNFEGRARGHSYRSGADPVIINHKGEFYLFGTIAGGYWHSKDLVSWKHIKPKNWPEREIVAPAAWSDGKRLYLFPSTYEQRPIYLIGTDKGGELVVYNDKLPFLPGAPGPWDPALFKDPDSGKWYMYFGSSNFYPLYGIELDAATQLGYVGAARELMHLRPEQHGWERFGRDHRDTIKPFMEGAWMTKHRGKYYFQYGGPGTEYNVYANGTYVGDNPLGPFTYAPNNPVSYKPGGFVTGAGHGNTFEDNHGNFWNTGTPWWAVNFDFERRIAMFPAGFDDDGLMFASTRFGDFPQRVPTSKWQMPEELFTGWMLLSYRKPATASSVFEVFAAANISDENPRTYWVAETNSPGQWITLDLGKRMEIRAIQVNFTDFRSGLFASDDKVFTQFKLLVSDDGKEWRTIVDLSAEQRDRPNAFLELAEPANTRFVKYEHVYVGSPNLAISDIRVFGHGGGSAPAIPQNVSVFRDPNDLRNAHVSWNPVKGAVGYNVLWGIAPEKMYQCYQVFADGRPGQEIRALTLGQGYSFCVESFSENGVSARSEIVSIK